jgi:protoporphyrinogen IX oxidase
MNFLVNAYPWIKALHIMSVIAWMSGLLYLPRLFVYHADAPVGSVQSETFKVMEARLSRIIMLPAAIATILFGGLMVGIPGLVDFHEHWFDTKMLLVILLLGYHHALARWRGAFARDLNRHPARFYRMMNEIPALIMVGIVILVVVRPF